MASSCVLVVRLLHCRMALRLSGLCTVMPQQDMKDQGMPGEKMNNSKSTIFILVIMFTTGFSGWLFLSPVIFGSAIFWIGAVLMGIPSYVVGENLGLFGLDSQFANRLSSSARIMVGVF